VCTVHPELCGDVCGDTCVDLATDSDNCGVCGHACKRTASCNGGVCGAEPGELVSPALGCEAIRLAYDAGAIYWTNMGDGTIKRIATSGGGHTVIASGVHPAAVYAGADEPLYVDGRPVATGILVHDGTVTFIAAPSGTTLDEQGLPHGSAGDSIVSVAAGQPPTTLLSAGLATEVAGAAAPISAITPSPDGQALYFAAGPRVYRMPHAGAKTAADVTLVGHTSAPDRSFATALAADDKHLFFPSSADAWVEIFDLGGACAGASTAAYTCPALVFGSHPIPLLDTVVVQGGYLLWGKENNVWRADLGAGDPALDGHTIASDTVAGFSVTGFAVDGDRAWFGESTYVETGSFVPVLAGERPLARILARGQNWPSSLVLDDANVYWTTAACDIAFTAKLPP
jgi:hypothetical protein